MFFFTIILMGILCGAEIDLFIPSFPELQEIFDLSPFMVELTLGVNLAAHCFTSLIMGNLGDKYGRKPVILIGLGIFSIGSLMCIYADNFPILLMGRFLQGVGISAPAVLSYLIIADKYNVTQQQDMMGKLNGVITIAMAFAPVIGSYVNKYYGWQGNFQLLFIIGILAFLLTIVYIPKGKFKDPHLKFSLKEYLPVIKSREAMYYIFSICFMVQAYWIFIGISPILYMGDLGVSLDHFGFYQGAIAGVFAIFSFATGFFIRRLGNEKCTKFGLGLQWLFIALCAIAIAMNLREAYVITLLMLVLAVAVIFPVNVMWPETLGVMPEAKGRVTAIFVSLRMIITAASLQIVSHLYQRDFKIIGVALIISVLLGIFFVHQAHKYKRA